MVTLIAFVLLGLVVVAACETTRGYFWRLMHEEPAMPVENPNPRSVR